MRRRRVSNPCRPRASPSQNAACSRTLAGWSVATSRSSTRSASGPAVSATAAMAGPERPSPSRTKSVSQAKLAAGVTPVSQ